MRQQSFTLILPSLLDYFHERGYFWTRSIAKFNASVKASLIEQHLVFKSRSGKFLESDEIGCNSLLGA